MIPTVTGAQIRSTNYSRIPYILPRCFEFTTESTRTRDNMVGYFSHIMPSPIK